MGTLFMVLMCTGIRGSIRMLHRLSRFWGGGEVDVLQ